MTSPEHKDRPKKEDNSSSVELEAVFEGLSIKVIIGDITKTPADIAVCSANNWLKLGSGSAGLIRDAGGQDTASRSKQKVFQLGRRRYQLPVSDAFWEEAQRSGADKIQLDCFDYMLSFDRLRALPIGSFAVTTSGDIGSRPELPQQIYHAVCMGYVVVRTERENKFGEKIPTHPAAIVQAVEKMLAALKKSGHETISTPLFGCNTGGLTPYHSAKAILVGSLLHKLKNPDSQLNINIVVPARSAEQHVAGVQKAIQRVSFIWEQFSQESETNTLMQFLRESVVRRSLVSKSKNAMQPEELIEQLSRSGDILNFVLGMIGKHRLQDSIEAAESLDTAGRVVESAVSFHERSYYLFGSASRAEALGHMRRFPRGVRTLPAPKKSRSNLIEGQGYGKLVRELPAVSERVDLADFANRLRSRTLDRIVENSTTGKSLLVKLKLSKFDRLVGRIALTEWLVKNT